jgi:hypothetical protein
VEKGKCALYRSYLGGYDLHLLPKKFNMHITAVLRIRIRIRIPRIHVFLGFLNLDPDPDPLVRDMDPDPDPDPSNIKQK